MTFQSIVILLLVFVLPVISHGDDVPLEYRVKAKYLLNIPLFAELPSHPQSCTAFTICMIGDTPLENLLEASRGKQIKKRPLTVKRIQNESQLDCCQMLFISSTERYRLQKLLTETNRRKILTISDMRDFIRQGGMINLLTINNRVTFDLNRAAARGASISFGTQLLKLANDVIN